MTSPVAVRGGGSTHGAFAVVGGLLVFASGWLPWWTASSARGACPLVTNCLNEPLLGAAAVPAGATLVLLGFLHHYHAIFAGMSGLVAATGLGSILVFVALVVVDPARGLHLGPFVAGLGATLAAIGARADLRGPLGRLAGRLRGGVTG